MSCRAEVLCYQTVQSHVVFSYVISQSDVEHDDLYCSNIKHHYLFYLYASSILLHCYALVNFPHYSTLVTSLFWSSEVPGAALMSSTVW